MNGRTSSGGAIAGVIAATLMVVCQSANAQQQEQQSAASRKSIEARVEALEARVRELEQRVEVPSRAGGAGKIARPSAVDESAITVQLVGKDFYEGDLLTGQVGDRIALELEFTSGLDKALRAFNGVVVLRDLFDQEVIRAGMTCAEELKPRQSARWHGILSYQQFDEKHRRLRSLGVKDLRTDFVMERVMYSDGSRDVFAESEETKSVQNKLVAADKMPTAKPKPTGPAAGPAPAGAPPQPVTPSTGSEAGATAP
jgi:hypothetical protein